MRTADRHAPRARLARRLAGAGVLTAALALGLGLGVAGAQDTTTTLPVTTTTLAPTTTTTLAPTTTSAPVTTTTLAPTTTTSHPVTTTTSHASTTTSSSTSTTTTTVPKKTTTKSKNVAWLWGLLGLLIVILIVLVIVLVNRGKATKAGTWRRGTLAVVNELDTLAVHIGSADEAALANLATRDAPRLAALAAQLQDLRAGAPEGAHVEDLARLGAAAGSLQTLLLGLQFTGEARPGVAQVHAAATEVTSAATSARAMLDQLAAAKR